MYRWILLFCTLELAYSNPMTGELRHRIFCFDILREGFQSFTTFQCSRHRFGRNWLLIRQLLSKLGPLFKNTVLLSLISIQYSTPAKLLL